MRRLSILCVLCLSFAATLAESATANAAVLIGHNHVETFADTGTAAPNSEAFGYTATASGTAGSISVYLDSTGGITVGLYAAGGSNRPGALLARGTNASNTAHAWATIPIPAVAINSGVQYWIAVGANPIQGETTGTITYRDMGNSGTSLDYSGVGFASPYARSAQWHSDPLSAYVSSTSTPPPPVKPANTVLPGITGTPQQGSTLTASTGTWTGTAPISYSYLWSDGKTGSTDLLDAGNVNQNVSVTVTATNSAGSTPATSATVGPVTGTPPPPGPPVNTGLPVVTGTAQQGATLTATNGSWTNSPTTYTYQWQQDGTQTITGATHASYTAQLGDVSHTLDVIVTATNAGGSTSQTSSQTGLVSGGFQFADEFSGSSVDTSLWTVLNEHDDQSSSGQSCYLPANVTEGSGLLTETAKSQSMTCPDGTGSVSYTSGAIQPKKFNYKYGTLIASVKFAGGIGTWPALWVLGAHCQVPSYLTNSCNWPTEGSREADIVELKNNGATSTAPLQNGVTVGGGFSICTPSVTTVTTGQNTIEFDWTSTQMTFIVNGVTTCVQCNTGSCVGSGTAGTYTNCACVPQSPMFPILNDEIGGTGGGGTISGLPQTSQMDYIHITTNSPVNTVLPTLSTSSPAHGSAVSVNSTGTWTNNASPTFTYAWQHCTGVPGSNPGSCTNIAGATSSSYTPPIGDVGDTLQAVVTSTTSTGASAATTVATSAVT
jgi:beta-glucanase (GH16 family)